MNIQPLEAIFDSSDWQALLQSGDISQDEFDVYNDAADDLALEARWNVEVRKHAAALADTHNESVSMARALRARIVAHGGLSPQYIKRWDGKSWIKKVIEEYESIPTKYKRKNGFAADEIASELDFEDDRALLKAIEDAEVVLSGLPVVSGKRLSKYRVIDWVVEAERRLNDECGRTWEAQPGDEVPF